MTARKNKKKKRTRFWYIQDWGIYVSHTPIFVGYTEREALKVMKGNNFVPKMVELFEKDIEPEDYSKNKAGFIWHKDGYTALFLTEFDGSWYSYDSLMHECMHLVLCQLGEWMHFITYDEDRKAIEIEQEGIAYAHEFLFRSIRRRLQKAFGYE